MPLIPRTRRLSAREVVPDRSAAPWHALSDTHGDSASRTDPHAPPPLPPRERLPGHGTTARDRLARGFLQHLADCALELAPVAKGCGITLQRQGQPLTVTSPGTYASALDEVHYGHDDGPCREALRTGPEVRTVDMRDERCWPRLPHDAKRLAGDRKPPVGRRAGRISCACRSAGRRRW